MTPFMSYRTIMSLKGLLTFLVTVNYMLWYKLFAVLEDLQRPQDIIKADIY
jgi:hypothetical protein